MVLEGGIDGVVEGNAECDGTALEEHEAVVLASRDSDGDDVADGVGLREGAILDDGETEADAATEGVVDREADTEGDRDACGEGLGEGSIETGCHSPHPGCQSMHCLTRKAWLPTLKYRHTARCMGLIMFKRDCD